MRALATAAAVGGLVLGCGDPPRPDSGSRPGQQADDYRRVSAEVEAVPLHRYGPPPEPPPIEVPSVDARPVPAPEGSGALRRQARSERWPEPEAPEPGEEVPAGKAAPADIPLQLEELLDPKPQ